MNFDAIRCYYDEDVSAKLWPLADRPEIEGFIKGAFPQVDIEQVRQTIRSCKTIKDFQTSIVIYFLDLLKKSCCDSIESYDVDKVDPSRGHIYITNHRDIVLDSAYLNVMLHHAGRETCEIAIGNNLFAAPWIEDLVRVNKSFVVRRDLTGRQMLESSKILSSYIRQEVHDKNLGVWIAQREGRSKDNSDQTQSSVIKMLAMGGPSRDLIQNIRDLHVVPVAISYEYDPCDYLKAAEFQLKRDNPEWKKSKADDVKSMVTGMRGYKGRVNYTFTEELNPIFDTFPWIDDKTAQVNCVCQTIDRALHNAMVLYPINYYAYNLKYSTEKYAHMYTAEERDKVATYLNGQLAKIDIPNKDEDFLWQMLLTMYSNPVANKEALTPEKEENPKPLTD